LITKISKKDKKDWEDFLTNKDSLPNKDLAVSKKRIEKTKNFDFHGFSLDEANKTINKLIKDSYKNGVRKLVVVTGKGIHSDNEKNPYTSRDFGILKHSMPEYIKKDPELMKLIYEIKEADIKIILIIIISSTLFVSYLYSFFDKWSGLVSYIDILTTAIFFVGMWLMARRKIESWFFWILGDVISVPLYFVKGLAFSSFQYLIFTLIAVAGYYKWKSIYNNKKRIA